ncbi:hypothetical protein [Achromobacter insuavis]|uniref:hypothetical protein n=1 Tax=Achromobacter insuavis TaxID=1287735 RepID=UPI0015D0F576|nr:hypothetical protein [Achromobacter insuavis]
MLTSYGFNYPVFWINKFHPPSVQHHTVFARKSPSEVDAFLAAAMKIGGTDNGAPSLQDISKGYPPSYCAVFAFYHDGNNMEAVY